MPRGVTSHTEFMNFRDLGGMPARTGRVAEGRLFRTAHLSRIGPEAAERPSRTLAVRSYFDFRTDAEIQRDGEPTALLERGVRWERHPFDLGDAVFAAVKRPTPGDWQALYERSAERLRREIAQVIRAIAAEERPVVFGCWAGKDRTGMLAAFLLSLLGVDDALIARDYARTTDGLRPFEHQFAFLWRGEPLARAELFTAYAVAPAEVMSNFLRNVRARDGSIETLLDLPREVVAALRERYWEEGRD